MSIDSKLKKEGIEVTKELNTKKVNKIAINVASKLCLAYPEHNFKRNELIESISKLKMYVANMPQDCSGAKYVFENNSIYFNKVLSLSEMSNLAVHECIHFLQLAYTSNSNMGLYNINSGFGMALNEAAVQLMSSEANLYENASETYFGISINTISPNYYPLECALVKQLTYFTGTYPLYHSTLYSDDIFKNTLMLKTSKKIYNEIVKNFDKLLSLENDLNYFVIEMQDSNKTSTIRALNNVINKTKIEITKVFFKTQDLIIESCFKDEFNSIRNLDDIKTFNQKLYNYKSMIGYSDSYTFYNEFYRKMMSAMQEKREYIERYGEINLYENINNSLMIVENSKSLFSFINKFVTKLKKLAKLNRNTNEEFNF